MSVAPHHEIGKMRLSPVALTVMLITTGCVATAPTSQSDAPAGSEPVRVTNGGQPFQMWEGAVARAAANAQCGQRGVRVSIYDRYDRTTGAWVYPDGCA